MEPSTCPCLNRSPPFYDENFKTLLSYTVIFFGMVIFIENRTQSGLDLKNYFAYSQFNSVPSYCLVHFSPKCDYCSRASI